MKYLIIGHFGGFNTGDEAMLYGFVESYDFDNNDEIFILSQEDSYVFNSDVKFSIIKPNTIEVLKAIYQNDVVILCGGTHFHDDYSYFRYLRHLRYLARFLVIFKYSELCGNKNIILGNGFGPFNRIHTKKLTRRILKYVDLITTRDQMSKNEIINIGLKNNVSKTFDLAALLYKDIYSVKDRNLVGISLTPINKYHDNGDEINELYYRKIFNAVKVVLNKNADLKIRIFIIRGGNRESDVEISKRLYKDLLIEFENSRIFLEEYHPNPQKTLHLISECGAGFVATRYHSAMLAYISRLRVLFLAYHRKLNDLATEINLNNRACVTLDENLDNVDLDSRLSELVDDDITYQPSINASLSHSEAKKNIVLLHQEVF